MQRFRVEASLQLNLSRALLKRCLPLSVILEEMGAKRRWGWVILRGRRRRHLLRRKLRHQRCGLRVLQLGDLQGCINQPARWWRGTSDQPLTSVGNGGDRR